MSNHVPAPNREPITPENFPARRLERLALLGIHPDQAGGPDVPERRARKARHEAAERRALVAMVKLGFELHRYLRDTGQLEHADRVAAGAEAVGVTASTAARALALHRARTDDKRWPLLTTRDVYGQWSNGKPTEPELGLTLAEVIAGVRDPETWELLPEFGGGGTGSSDGEAGA